MRSAAKAIKLMADASQAENDLQLLARAAELSQGVRDRLLGIFPDAVDLAAHIRGVNVDPPAAGAADEVWVRLELSDALSQLVAAVRAGEFDGFPAQVDVHGGLHGEAG